VSWLHDLFRRPQTPPAESTTSYGALIERLAATNDPEERTRLGKQLALHLERAIGSQSNTMQVALWKIEEEQRERLGATNDMLSELLAMSRAAQTTLSSQGAAVEELREGFPALASRINEVGESVSGLAALSEERFTAIDKRFSAMEQRGVVVTTAMDSMARRVTAMEQEFERRGPFIRQIPELVEQVQALRYETLGDEITRETRERLTAGLRELLDAQTLERLTAIETELARLRGGS